jgi:hypothetical protein
MALTAFIAHSAPGRKAGSSLMHLGQEIKWKDRHAFGAKVAANKKKVSSPRTKDCRRLAHQHVPILTNSVITTPPNTPKM